MALFQAGDRVQVVDFATRAHVSQHLPDLPIVEVVRQMQPDIINDTLTAGIILDPVPRYELSSGAIVPEHQLVRVDD
ncbi:MAG: hypothetical protein C5B60_06690 [Chloroflexi bacterium]|nr:MAG: hypothetical protein C5B60_06690 [Chloroflexota bacterium]